MKEAVLGEVLEQKYADARQKENQVFLDAMQMFATGRTDKEIESIVLKLYELAQSYPFPDEQLEQWKNSYAMRSVEEMEQTEWMEKYIADVQMIVAECEKKAFAAYQISVARGWFGSIYAYDPDRMAADQRAAGMQDIAGTL